MNNNQELGHYFNNALNAIKQAFKDTDCSNEKLRLHALRNDIFALRMNVVARSKQRGLTSKQISNELGLSYHRVDAIYQKYLCISEFVLRHPQQYYEYEPYRLLDFSIVHPNIIKNKEEMQKKLQRQFITDELSLGISKKALAFKMRMTLFDIEHLLHS